MRPTFADPKIDFVFKRIFGSEEHKDVLLAFLNDVLELPASHRIHEVHILSPEQRPKIEELKLSIVDVLCVDARGTRYVVEMQVLNVEAFEKRVVYNVAKSYVNQLERGRKYPELDDVIGITICDFELWPRSSGSPIPMLSRWSMSEHHTSERGLAEIQFVFLELPKLDVSRPPASITEKWAYFFREAESFEVAPEVLAEPQLRRALDAARTAGFTPEEWDLYIRAGMAIQDEVGALAIARKEGIEQGKAEGIELGRAEGLRRAIEDLAEILGVALTPERRMRLEAMDTARLESLRASLKQTRSWPGSLD